MVITVMIQQSYFVTEFNLLRSWFSCFDFFFSTALRGSTNQSHQRLTELQKHRPIKYIDDLLEALHHPTCIRSHSVYCFLARCSHVHHGITATSLHKVYILFPFISSFNNPKNGSLSNCQLSKLNLFFFLKLRNCSNDFNEFKCSSRIRKSPTKIFFYEKFIRS